MKRCRWADPNSELYIAYHDNEWGRPEHDDRKLFEMLTLEGFQAGLSWLTILKKREAFRRAFDNFQPDVIVQYLSLIHIFRSFSYHCRDTSK